MLNDIESINKYIKENKDKVNQTYRPKFHMVENIGWMNDPNGLIYKDGVYHLYYQANPFDMQPGKMLWGHFVSKDLIEFEDLGIALAPEGKGENAFSGGAIAENDLIHIFYTLHTSKKEENVVYIDGKDKSLLVEHSLNEEVNELHKSLPRVKEDASMKSEEVYHSYSKDGNLFLKGEKVFDNETLPKNLSRIDFRDPCPTKINGYYYIFLGARDEELDQGLIVVLKGKTLDHFEYDFQIGPFEQLGFMGECPSLAKVGTKDVLVASGCSVKRVANDFRNMNSSVFIVGNIDFENKSMKVDYIREIDKGDSFYAPQFISNSKEPIMVGWHEMWEKHYLTKKLNHGWVGSFTLPRVLKEVNGEIYQEFVPSLYNHLKDYEGNKLPKCSLLTFDIAVNSKVIIKGDNGIAIIGNNDLGIYLDNASSNSLYRCVRHTNGLYTKAHLEVLLDVSSLEILIENGKESITSRIYLDGELEVFTEKDVTNLKIKEVIPNL